MSTGGSNNQIQKYIYELKMFKNWNLQPLCSLFNKFLTITILKTFYQYLHWNVQSQGKSIYQPSALKVIEDLVSTSVWKWWYLENLRGNSFNLDSSVKELFLTSKIVKVIATNLKSISHMLTSGNFIGNHWKHESFADRTSWITEPDQCFSTFWAASHGRRLF